MKHLLLSAGFVTLLASTAKAQTPAVGLLSDNRITILAGPGSGRVVEGPYFLAGVAAGERIVALDQDPASGTLYGLGYNAASESATLYTVNPRQKSVMQIGHGLHGVRLRSIPALFEMEESNDAQGSVLHLVTDEGSSYLILPQTSQLISAATRTPAAVPENPYSCAVVQPTTMRVNGVIRADGAANAGAELDVARLTGRSGESASGESRVSNAYPNPAIATTRIQFNEHTFGATRVEVVDLNGRMWSSFELGEGSSGFDLDVSSYSPGIYVVRIVQRGVLTDQVKLLRAGL